MVEKQFARTDFDTDPKVYPNTVGVYVIPLEYLKDEFKFSASTHNLIDQVMTQNITHFRKSRGDGNCYFRAVCVSYLEHLVLKDRIPDFLALLTEKPDHFNISGFPNDLPIVMSLKASLQKLQTSFNSPLERLANLQKLLQHEPFDKNLVTYFKYVTASYLRFNSENPEITLFLVESIESVIAMIIKEGEEAQGITFKLLTEAFGIEVTHVTFYPEPPRVGYETFGTETKKYPETIHINLRPGHYDIMYTASYLQEAQYNFLSAKIGGYSFALPPVTFEAVLAAGLEKLSSTWKGLPEFDLLQKKLESTLESTYKMYPDEDGTLLLHNGEDQYGSGRGVILTDEYVYIGPVIAEVPANQGEMFFTNGEHYEGRYRHGVREGHGKLTNLRNTPEEYDGNWNNDVRSGKGRETLKDYIYDGQWLQDKRHGDGVLVERSGKQRKWEGKFKEGKITDGIRTEPHFTNEIVFMQKYKDDGTRTMEATVIINGKDSCYGIIEQTPGEPPKFVSKLTERNKSIS